MTVKELIDELKNYDENKQVYVYCSYDCGFGTAGGNVIEVCEENDHVELINNEC